MGNIAGAGVEDLPPHHEVLPTPLPRIIPFEKYNKEGGILNPDDYSFVNNLLNDTKGSDGERENPHIKQALNYAVGSGLLLRGTKYEDLPPQVKDTLKIYALIRKAGINVLNRDRIVAREIAKKVPLPYQENVPISEEEASVGEWALVNIDQVVFAEARRLIGGWEAYRQYAKQNPNIFKEALGLKPENVTNLDRVAEEELKAA